ncbi:MAG: YggS family pyridoxal phosphate-dependent enzyme [Duncaniella sp.]|nr:YggS family pyridoxal phosphate-dependent enzyme [Duncaniella sp.]
MTDVAANLSRVAATIPAGVILVAVSKFHPVEALRCAYDAGQRVFAESRAQELAVKAPALPPDIEWHFIGHLQTNKVRAVLPHVSLIQSIDSSRLLRAVSDEAVRQGRVVDVLLEVNVTADGSKTGMAPDEFDGLAAGFSSAEFPGVRVRGLMGMATFTDDTAVVRRDFEALRGLFDSLRSGVFSTSPEFDILSMGMSDDRDIAIACGSTMVRVGTDIFGYREY